MTYYTRCLSQYECWAHRNRQCWDYGPCPSIECAQRRQYNSLYLYPSARSFTDYYTPQIWIGPVSTTNNVLPPKVHRQRLKLKGSHGRDHVMMNYGFELLGPESIERMKKQLDQESIDVRSWASDQLRTRMLNKALSLNMQYRGQRINKHKDIKSSWKEDPSDENAAKMYEVMFGDYENKNAAWSRTMERQYMESRDIEYLPDALAVNERTQKGCYEKIITKSKTIQVRLMNRDSARYINMSLPQKMVVTIPIADRQKIRRKRGDFYIVDAETVRE